VFAIALAIAATPAGASVTLGQIAPSAPANTCSNISGEWIQPIDVSGNQYVVPGAGTITSWSTRASGTAGQRWSMKLYRKVSGTTYAVVGRDGPRDLAAGLNSFPVSVPAQPGDLLGMQSNDGATASTACLLPSPGNTIFFHTGDLGDGQGTIATSGANFRLNISAVFEPDNAFSLAAATRNKRKGTAVIVATLPNPGMLTGSGTAIKVKAPGAKLPRQVAAGPALLVIKATGKKKRKLRATGKVTVRVSVVYTPSGGAPHTETLKLKLRRKKR
jgi:hypothetical protein